MADDASWRKQCQKQQKRRGPQLQWQRKLRRQQQQQQGSLFSAVAVVVTVASVAEMGEAFQS